MKRVLVFFYLLAAIPANAAEVRVAAASDLTFAIKEIISEFEQQTGHKVLLSPGSSGNFFAQISNGAPFEVFLSADVMYPRQLEKAGLAVPESTFIYGIGRIVLWSRSIDLNKGMNALLDPAVRKIAIANPQHAPYGRAAVAAMQHAKVYDRVKDKLVLGENISQAAQFVQSGAADLGIVALSLALSDPMRNSGRYWLIPVDTYPRLEQGVVLLKKAGPAARQFFDWLRSPASQKIFEKYGFSQL